MLHREVPSPGNDSGDKEARGQEDGKHVASHEDILISVTGCHCV